VQRQAFGGRLSIFIASGSAGADARTKAAGTAALPSHDGGMSADGGAAEQKPPAWGRRLLFFFSRERGD